MDSLRLFFRKYLIFKKGLSFRQRLHYLEIGCSYLLPALIFPVLMLLLPVSIILEIDLILGDSIFPVLKSLQLMSTLFFFWKQSDCKWSEIQFWIGLFPVYLKALFLALLPWKPEYRITAKAVVNNHFHLWLIAPHLFYLALNVFALYWYIVYLEYGLNNSAIFSLCWFCLLIFWFWPVLKKGMGITETGKRSRKVEVAEKDAIRGIALENKITEFAGDIN